MKYIKLTMVIVALFMFGCAGNNKPKPADSTKAPKLPKASNAKSNDKEEIQSLIRNMLVWAENSKGILDLLPFVINKQDSTVTSFDLSKLKEVDDSFKTTGFFSKEFINNYNQIIQTLDRKMKNKEIAPFSPTEIPPFGFDTDADPWCDCQDVPYDNPNAYSLVDVHIIELSNESGKMYWTWGSLPKGVSPDWKTVTYKFNVTKEGGKWKISYLQGFDIKRA